jgi:WD40 repeat protein/predicted Ser/Thr protein kinase
MEEGDILGNRYKIVSLIGKGGMGKVFRATDVKLQEDVALKMLEQDLEEEAMQRFIREIKLARTVTHENICRIYQFEEMEGKQFISMQFIDGTDLGTMLKQGGPIGPELAIPILKDICRGLSAIHANGIVHRDLKPANIMIDKQGKAFITDFGIAKGIGVDGLTQTGTSVGTPAYMAPEQVKGQAVDERSDIYSLGVMMYLIFSGRLPYEADSNISMAVKHITEEPEPIEASAPHLPPSLRLLIQSCMAKNKETRSPSVKEVLRSLEEIEAGGTFRSADILPPPPPPAYTPDRAPAFTPSSGILPPEPGKKARKGLLIGAVLSALAVAAVALILILMQGRQPSEQRIAASGLGGVVQPEQAAEGSQEKIQAEPEIPKKAEDKISVDPGETKSKSDQAAAEVEDKPAVKKTRPETPPEAKPETVVRREAEPEPDVREKTGDKPAEKKPAATEPSPRERWDTWQGRFERSVQDVVDREADSAADPGSLIQAWEEVQKEYRGDNPFSEEDDQLRRHVQKRLDFWRQKLVPTSITFPLQTGREINAVKTAKDMYRFIAYSPDGRFLVHLGAYNSRVVNVLNAENFRREVQLTGYSKGINKAVFSPDGRWLATASDDYTVKVWDWRAKKEVKTLSMDNRLFLCLGFSPDGKRLAAGENNGRVYVWNTGTWVQEKELKPHRDDIRSLVFSRDGQWILTGSEDDTAKITDITSGEAVQEFVGHKNDVYSARFSPDEKTVVTGARHGNASIWSVESGKSLKSLVVKNEVRMAKFSPDGRFVAVSAGVADSKHATLWEIGSSREAVRFMGHILPVYSLDFHPDGKHLVTLSLDETIRLWDISASPGVRVLSGHTESIKALDVDSQGHYAISGAGDNTACIWNLYTGKVEQTLSHDNDVDAVVLSPDGKLAATGGTGRKLNIWDVLSGNLLQSIDVDGYVRSVDFSPDGRSVVVNSGPKGTVGGKIYADFSVWNVSNFQMVCQAQDWQSGDTKSVVFSPDGRRVAYAHSKGVYIADAASGRRIKSLSSLQAWDVVFSGDGRLLSAGFHDTNIRIWEVSSGRLTKTIKTNKYPVYEHGMTADGRYVLGVNNYLFDKPASAIQIWAVESRRPVETLYGHSADVQALRITKDGRFILSAGSDKTIRIWKNPLK